MSQSSPGPCSIESPFTNMWTTNVIIKYPDGGPVPDTATYIQKLEREREARERGEAKDNRPYLSKYVSLLKTEFTAFICTSSEYHYFYVSVDVYFPCIYFRRLIVGDKSRSWRSSSRRQHPKAMMQKLSTCIKVCIESSSVRAWGTFIIYRSMMYFRNYGCTVHNLSQINPLT